MRHHQRAGRDRPPPPRRGRCGLLDLDAIAVQQRGEMERPAAIAVVEQHVLPHGLAARALVDRRAPEGGVLTQQLLALEGRGVRGGHGGSEVLDDAVHVGQKAAVAASDGEAAGRRLLERHPDRTLGHRPGHAVAGIERVEHFAREIRKATIVEGRADGLAKHLQRRVLRRRGVRVARLRCRWKEVGAVAAHLVQVDHDLRQPLEQDRDTAAALGLCLREPVAIQIEEVMVGAAAGPGLVVFGGQAQGVGDAGATGPGGLDEAPATIGVLQRVDQHDRLAQDGRGPWVVLRGQQMVRLEHRCAGRRDLVAVHAVQQRHHDRRTRDHRLDIGSRQQARIGKAPQVLLDVVQRRQTLRGANRQHQQWPVLEGPPVLDQPRTVRHGGGQRAHVEHDLFRRADLLAVVVADHLGQRRNGAVVLEVRQRLAAVL